MLFYETPFILEKKHFGVKVVQRKVYIKFLLLALAEIAKVYSHQFIVDPSITVAAGRWRRARESKGGLRGAAQMH